MLQHPQARPQYHCSQVHPKITGESYPHLHFLRQFTKVPRPQKLPSVSETRPPFPNAAKPKQINQLNQQIPSSFYQIETPTRIATFLLPPVAVSAFNRAKTSTHIAIFPFPPVEILFPTLSSIKTRRNHFFEGLQQLRTIPASNCTSTAMPYSQFSTLAYKIQSVDHAIARPPNSQSLDDIIGILKDVAESDAFKDGDGHMLYTKGQIAYYLVRTAALQKDVEDKWPEWSDLTAEEQGEWEKTTQPSQPQKKVRDVTEIDGMFSLFYFCLGERVHRSALMEFVEMQT